MGDEVLADAFLERRILRLVGSPQIPGEKFFGSLALLPGLVMEELLTMSRHHPRDEAVETRPTRMEAPLGRLGVVFVVVVAGLGSAVLTSSCVYRLSPKEESQVLQGLQADGLFSDPEKRPIHHAAQPPLMHGQSRRCHGDQGLAALMPLPRYLLRQLHLEGEAIGVTMIR